MYSSKDTETLLKKNKPSIIFPIICTVISVILIGLATYIMIIGQMKWYYGSICYVIFIMFAISSWYNSYFSKKANLKKIKNYDKETEIIVNYVKRYKNSSAIKLTLNEHIYVEVKNTDKLLNQDAVYNEEKFSFGSHIDDKILISFGVSFAGLEVDPKTNQVVGVIGVLPKSIWINKRLKAPDAPNKAKMYLSYEGFKPNPKTVVQYLNKEDFYYDKKSGWLMIGSRKKTKLDEPFYIMNNVIVVVRDKEISALWIKIQPNMDI